MTKAWVSIQFEAELSKVDSILIEIGAIGGVENEQHIISIIR
jgi:hypothetical protein